MEELFESLNTQGIKIPPYNKLVDKDEILKLEIFLDLKLPESYKYFLQFYSDITLGHDTFLKPINDGSFFDFYLVYKEILEINELPSNYLPFAEDNSDYYCFNLEKNSPDYEVVYWSHNGKTDEKWKNFEDWVENCWIKESLNPDNSWM